MITYFIKVPHLLVFQVLGINVLASFIVLNTVACLQDLYLRQTYLCCGLIYFNWDILACEATDEAADETHIQGLHVRTLGLLTISLRLWTAVVSAEWTSNVIPVLETHPVEGVAAKNGQSEVVCTSLADFCHLLFRLRR